GFPPNGSPTGSRGAIQLSYAPTPANDDFSNAQTIIGISGNVNGTNVGATREQNEPFHDFGGRAFIWYRWHAPNSGVVTFNTNGRNFTTFLGVYISLSNLIASNYYGLENPQGPATVTFPAVSGTTYYIAIDGRNPNPNNVTTGNTTLNWSYKAVSAT